MLFVTVAHTVTKLILSLSTLLSNKSHIFCPLSNLTLLFKSSRSCFIKDDAL